MDESRIDRCGQTQSNERRRDQLGTGVREANAEIQSGSHFIRIDRSRDIDPIFINRLVGFSKIAFQDERCPLKVKHGKAKGE